MRQAGGIHGPLPVPQRLGLPYEDHVEGWLVGQIPVNNEANQQPPLQDQERWLVAVVDFRQHSQQWMGISKAENMLNQAVVPYIEQLSEGEANLSMQIRNGNFGQSFPLKR